MSAIIFGLSSYLHGWSPTDFLFLFSMMCPHLTAFPFEFLPVNSSPLTNCFWYISIFNLGVCYYLGFQELTIHVPTCFSIIIMPLPLSLCLESISHICSFLSTVFWLTQDLASKQLTTKTITQNTSLYYKSRGQFHLSLTSVTEGWLLQTSLHNSTNFMKKCVNIHWEEKALWS